MYSVYMGICFFCPQIRRLWSLANGIYNSKLNARCQAKCFISEALKTGTWDLVGRV